MNIHEDIHRHETFMRRCLQLASNGVFSAAPNPLVGAVIVCNDLIVGEGFHTAFGKNHAEIEAFNNVKDKSLLQQSTLYVNLEPCSHHGKTPPCVEAILKQGIPRVVIANIDPFPKVRGNGISILKENGVEVIEGVLAEEAAFLNRRFFHFHKNQKPYVILKWAESQDGFMDARRNGEQGINWISGPEAKKLVHTWRASEQSILVGSQTALNDNPSLTVREVSGKNPLRIVIDRNLVVPNDSKIFSNESETIVVNDKLSKTNDTIEWVKFDFSENVIDQLLSLLFERNIISIIVEGGARTLVHFIDEDKWDEARVITGNIFLEQGLSAPELKYFPVLLEKSGSDTIRYFYRT
ncbi:MAG: bifunctional diaminohydroxyphosphoribosylaminopyrimidine deaminase/5-amino-6-(5-phosphoribosylamino)uracil reductase RibD [Flavobacteriales bacterium]|nr:bifunctional diaminohydroxyphosphoribosylaminopyrimidine deaminase/5-amino-6-(5-phosphoribosylamino)uracil reductase RibD [Flavobacteriales bacterium]